MGVRVSDVRWRQLLAEAVQREREARIEAEMARDALGLTLQTANEDGLSYRKLGKAVGVHHERIRRLIGAAR